MQNRTLYEKHKQMMQAVMILLDRDVNDYPYEENHRMEPTEAGLVVGKAYVVSFSSAVWSRKSQIEGLPEFASCLSEIESVCEISTNVREKARDLLHELILRTLSGKSFAAWDPKTFFTKYNEARPNLFKFDEEIFSKQYSKLEHVIYSGNLWIAFAPLSGYESDCDDVKLGSVSIKKMPEKELAELWNNNQSLSTFILDLSFRDIKYCLWSEQKEQIHPVLLFDSVVKSLRLWQTGSVGYKSGIFILPLFGHQGGNIPWNARMHYFHQPKFILKLDEVEKFKMFFNELVEIENKLGELDLALLRFGFSYERNRLEDSLIDLMIAFESLFCEDSGDLTYKLSTRVARFLEQEPEKREKLRENIREAYNIRGKVVHGNKRISRRAFWQQETEKTSLNPNEYLPLIEDYLRRCLRKLIDMTYACGESLDRSKIMKKIDFGS